MLHAKRLHSNKGVPLARVADAPKLRTNYGIKFIYLGLYLVALI